VAKTTASNGPRVSHNKATHTGLNQVEVQTLMTPALLQTQASSGDSGPERGMEEPGDQPMANLPAYRLSAMEAAPAGLVGRNVHSSCR
jgi:hypothetical protein